jgi:hypothetical protein
MSIKRPRATVPSVHHFRLSGLTRLLLILTFPDFAVRPERVLGPFAPA